MLVDKNEAYPAIFTNSSAKNKSGLTDNQWCLTWIFIWFKFTSSF